ncbi:MAG: TetR/AcrR family transcriptional regulator [Actinomycetota bacterium]
MKRPYGTLSSESAAAAAVMLGFEDLTVAAVADHLGVTPAALYYHVKDRADLVVAAMDWVLDNELEPIGPITDIAAFVRDEGMAMYKLFKNHPGLTTAIHSMGEPNPGFARRFETAHAALVAHGVSMTDAYFMLGLVYAHVLQTGTWLTSPEIMTARRDASVVSVDGEGRIEDMWATLSSSPPDDSYQRMLGLLIHGVVSLEDD